ncbi:MAG: hypothetical protein J6K61_04810 [Clostridia bacterium]|nr:hypothetical protein [Clostridia bacterium]
MEKVFKFKGFALLDGAVPWIVAVYCMIEVFLAAALPSAFLESLLRIAKFAIFFLFLCHVTVDMVKGYFPFKKSNLLFLAFFILGLCIYFGASNIGLYFVLIPLLLVVLRDRDFRDITKKTSLLVGIALLTVILLSLVGVLPNEVFSTRGETERYTLGFTYATLSQTIVMFVSLTLNFSYREKTPYWLLALEVAVSVFVYIYTDTRTGFFLTLVIVIFTLFAKWRRFLPFQKTLSLSFLQKPAFYNTLCFFPLLLFVGFGILTILYQNEVPLAISANRFMSNRLLYTARAFAEQPLTLFGEMIDWYIPTETIFSELPIEEIVEKEYMGVDSAYYYYLFKTGVVGFLMVMTYDILACRHALKEKDSWLIFALFICLMDGLLESYLCDIRYNVFVLCLAYMAKGRGAPLTGKLCRQNKKERDCEQ